MDDSNIREVKHIIETTDYKKANQLIELGWALSHTLSIWTEPYPEKYEEAYKYVLFWLKDDDPPFPKEQGWN